MVMQISWVMVVMVGNGGKLSNGGNDSNAGKLRNCGNDGNTGKLGNAGNGK